MTSEFGLRLDSKKETIEEARQQEAKQAEGDDLQVAVTLHAFAHRPNGTRCS